MSNWTQLYIMLKTLAVKTVSSEMPEEIKLYNSAYNSAITDVLNAMRALDKNLDDEQEK